MRVLPVLLFIALATPALADLRPDGTTAQLGLGVVQNGVTVALDPVGEAYVAQLSPGGFTLTITGGTPEVLAVSFGSEGLFDLIDLPPETRLFGPGTAYAREEGPGAVHFMTDPLCASTYYGPGFNLLDDTRRTPEGYPVAALHVDAASRSCTVEGRLPSDTDLLGRLSPIYAVVRTDAGIERLILQFVGS